MNTTIFSISTSKEDPGVLHVEMAAATDMSFDISIKDQDYGKLIRDICQVAPMIMEMDVALMEAQDGSEVQVNPLTSVLINRFAKRYKQALSNVDVYVTEELGGSDADLILSRLRGTP